MKKSIYQGGKEKGVNEEKAFTKAEKRKEKKGNLKKRS